MRQRVERKQLPFGKREYFFEEDEKLMEGENSGREENRRESDMLEEINLPF